MNEEDKKMLKYFGIVFLVCFITLGIIVLMMKFIVHPITKQEFSKIQIGMSEQQVESIIGKPADKEFRIDQNGKFEFFFYSNLKFEFQNNKLIQYGDWSRP